QAAPGRWKRDATAAGPRHARQARDDRHASGRTPPRPGRLGANALNESERKTNMATTADIPRLEMLQVAAMVAREKSIEREEVLEAMEQAIQKAGRAKDGREHDI